MRHLTTTEAVAKYHGLLTPAQLRRKAATDPRWPQPIRLGHRTLRWPADAVERHARKLRGTA